MSSSLPVVIIVCLSSNLDACVKCNSTPSLVQIGPLTHLPNTTNSSSSDEVHNVNSKELRRTRFITFHYAFAAFGVVIIIGLLFYCPSVPAQEIKYNVEYKAMYRAPRIKKKFLTSVKNSSARSGSNSTCINNATTPNNTEAEEYWWDEEQEL